MGWDRKEKVRRVAGRGTLADTVSDSGWDEGQELGPINRLNMR